MWNILGLIYIYIYIHACVLTTPPSMRMKWHMLSFLWIRSYYLTIARETDGFILSQLHQSEVKPKHPRSRFEFGLRTPLIYDKHASYMHVCMYVWMDGCMNFCIYSWVRTPRRSKNRQKFINDTKVDGITGFWERTVFWALRQNKHRSIVDFRNHIYHIQIH